MQSVAIIIGGSSGIGAQLVGKYCAEGYRVYSTYHSSKEKASKLQATYPDNLYFSQVNLKQEDSIVDFFTTINKHEGKIDCLINNAGVVYPSDFSSLTLKSWQDTFAVNVYAPFLCIKHAAPLLRNANQPSIVNISSMRGLDGCGGLDTIDYSASKAAVINMTQTLAKIFSKIRINSIAPGFVATENSSLLPSILKKSVKTHTSIQRFIKMSEVADLCYYLTSPMARAITGTIIPIDGGYSLVKP